MTTHDQLYTAIEQGMNIEKLLLATGLDVETFNMNMENNEWNHEQVKAIRNTIKDWEDGK